MLQEDMNARMIDFRLSQKHIEHKLAWEELSRFDRLERALKGARAKLHFAPTFSARTN